MSIVKINAIEPEAGKSDELEQRFRARVGAVEHADGFEELMVLRPTENETRYFVMTRWASEEAFQRWRSGDAFRHQHRETHEAGGAGAARPDHPVVRSASLLSFDVVSRVTK